MVVPIARPKLRANGGRGKALGHGVSPSEEHSPATEIASQQRQKAAGHGAPSLSFVILNPIKPTYQIGYSDCSAFWPACQGLNHDFQKKFTLPGKSG
jgi:hypothetical protein